MKKRHVRGRGLFMISQRSSGRTEENPRHDLSKVDVKNAEDLVTYNTFKRSTGENEANGKPQ
jgi:hypothetical protein